MLLLTSAMLAALIDRRDVRLKQPVKLDGSRPLLATLNHFTLRFEIARA